MDFQFFFCKSLLPMREFCENNARKCENLDEIKKYYQWTFSRILVAFH